MIARLIESGTFPFTMSVSAGVDTPAGIDVRRSMPIASSGLKIFIEKKKNTGIMNI
jgi:hypothetical protein